MDIQKSYHIYAVNIPVHALGGRSFVAFIGLIAVFIQLLFPRVVVAEEWVAPSYKSRKENPVAATAESVKKGGIIYQRQCVVCHGGAGKGDGPAGLAMKPSPADLTSATTLSQSDGALFWKLSAGRAPMPGFEALTSEEDRWNIINYIRSLAPASPNSFTSSNDKDKTKEGAK